MAQRKEQDMAKDQNNEEKRQIDMFNGPCVADYDNESFEETIR